MADVRTSDDVRTGFRKPSPLDAWFDHPVDGGFDFFRRSMTVILPPTPTAELQCFAIAEGVAWSSVVLAGLGVFLGRHAGAEHFVIGVLAAETLAVPITLDGSETAAHLSRTLEASLSTAISDDVDTVLVRIGSNRSNVVDAITDGHSASVEARAALIFTADLGAKGLTIECDYLEELFDADHLCKRLQRLPALLAAIARPGLRLRDLRVLTADERAEVITAGDGPTRDWAISKPIHRLFEVQTARTPDQIAVIYDDTLQEVQKTVTFRELNRHANGLARRLTLAGLRPGDVVGLHLHRSDAAVAAMLAVMKAGGVYLPLDPAYPVTRLKTMIGTARARFLITGDTSDTLDFDGITFGPDDAVPSDVNSDAADDLDRDFCLIFTSGSTGTPKAVRNHHRATLNCFHWMWEEFPFADGEVAAAITSPSFGDSIQELFGPLLQGVPIAVVPPWAVKTPGRLVQLLEQYRVTRITLVPSLLRVLMDPSLEVARRVPGLSLWICSGEALPEPMATRFGYDHPAARLINLYGASEMSNDVTWHEVNADDEGTGVIPLGRPIPNVQVYVLDAEGQPVPAGAVGEIFVAGAGVTHGYLHNRQATSLHYLTGANRPAWLAERAERLYRTGDLGRRRNDGVLEFAGRRDLQVKIRGFRVEIEEIETQLLAHAGVCQAVVSLFQDDDGANRLAAQVVPVTVQTAPDIAALKVHLQARLPDFMVPALIRLVPDLPLTPSGKVDRAALTPFLHERGHEANTPPQTEMEVRLARLWTSILGVELPGRDESFDALGGHSLAAAILLVRVETEFGVPLNACDLQEAPTLRELASRIDGCRGAQGYGLVAACGGAAVTV